MDRPAGSDEDLLLAVFAQRPTLMSAYMAARQVLLPLLAPGDLRDWQQAGLWLYQANAGPAVLAAVWQLQRRVAAFAAPGTLSSLAASVHRLCLNAGARDTCFVIETVMGQLRHGTDAEAERGYLALLAELSDRAPDAARPVGEQTGLLLKRLAVEDIALWMDDGLQLYPTDRRRRLAYFRLEDPLSRRRLSYHEGHARFGAHKDRLAYLVRGLFDLDLKVQEIPADEDGKSPARLRLAGGTLLVPESMPRIPSAQAAAFFEAAILHAVAHRRFTTRSFAVNRMKPMQIALTALIEDARVERLAARDYPGLARLWRTFHTIPASPARACGSLFARLARALADPDFRDPDGWVTKASGMFEQAFDAHPESQDLSVDLARILGHDLGQMRIPFDARSYVVEPAYRDDGLGLFDPDEAEPDDSDRVEIMLDAAPVDPQDAGESEESDAEPDEVQPARAHAADEAPGVPLLARYPEWNYRLRTDRDDFADVYGHPAVPLPGPNWLTRRMEENERTADRVGALVRRTRLGLARRLKRRSEGDDLDLDGVLEAVVSRRARLAPDPRVYMVRRRLERDVSVALLIDTSLSTGDRLAANGSSILETAALSSALLGNALAGLGDPFAIFSFCSSGRGDVRLKTIKDFDGDAQDMVGRLAGLMPSHSTRLGAALRHVGGVAAAQPTLRRMVIVITDGEPADIDVDDPDYLAADARHAVGQVRGKGVDLFCVALGARAYGAASTIFGRRNTFAVETIADLPSRLAGLYFRLAVL